VKPSTPLVLAAAVAAGAVGIVAELHLRHAGPGANEPATATAPAPGDPMPEIALPGLDGRIVRLPEDFRGRPLLLNFWASWCAPCLEEMPALQRFAGEQAGNVRVVGIALDEAEAVRGFLAHTPVDYPILLDSPGGNDASVRLGDSRGVLPYSVLVDADGRIVKARTGPFGPGEIAGWAGAPAVPGRPDRRIP
jgi:thiol-disulfide isomerase/thioredoxin